MTIFSHFFGYFASQMKKRSKIFRVIKAILITLSIPVLLFWVLMLSLYMPPVQRFAVKTICEEASKATGFNVGIGRFNLTFPLKLHIEDIKLSKGDTIYADSRKTDVHISLFPLFGGEVEVNYLSLEGIRLNTMDLIPDIKMDGEIGFFRAVARNVDLNKELIHLRQLHLHSTNLNIELNNTTATEEDEEEDSTPLNWAVNLHRGNIENCRINVSIPSDTLKAGIGIGKMRMRNGTIDLGKGIYSIAALNMDNCDGSYDLGNDTRDNAPLDHIRINNINLDTRNIAYTPDSSRIEIHDFTFIQPGGIRITDTKADIFADTTRLDIRDFSLVSKNGTRLSARTTLPWKALNAGIPDKIDADVTLEVAKNDLAALLTSGQYDGLSLFGEKILCAGMHINGNMSDMTIDTLDMQIPSIATLHANGHARNLNDFEKLEAVLNIKGGSKETKKIIRNFIPADSIAAASLASTPDTGILDIAGTVSYTAGEAFADIVLEGTSGNIKALASYDTGNDIYKADITTTSLNIATLLPEIPLYNLQMSMKANGEGTDLFDNDTRYDVDIVIDSVHYDRYRISDLQIAATQEHSISDIKLSANDFNLKMTANATTRLDSTHISNKTSINVDKADLMGLGLTEAAVDTKIKLNLEASTDMGERHSIKFKGRDIGIITDKKTYTPADISLDMSTSPAHSHIEAKNGDLRITGAMESGYNGLIAAMEKVADMYMQARNSETMPYYLHDYERMLPALSFGFECGKKNMLANTLAINGMTTDKISLELKLDTVKGLNMNGGIYGFNNSSIKLDTIRVFTRQQDNRIAYLASVRSTALDPNNEKQSFSASLYGNVCMDSLTTNIMFRDKKNGTGIKMGAIAIMKPEELNISFKPEAILMKNRFMFNEDNYIRIGKGMSVDADVTLSNGKDAGMHLFTTPDPTAKYNANLELFNINLKEVTSMAPFVPDIAGQLNLDLYFRQDDTSMLISSDIRADSIAYEGTYIGNEILELVYLPKNDDTHYLDVILRHEEEEVAHLNGNYINDNKDPGLHGDITLTKFPLSISNAFLKDTGMGLSGYINSEVSANGQLSELKTDGFMQFDSVYIDAPLFGTSLHMANERVSINDNRITFKDFDIYSAGNNPFKINGNIDLSNISDPAINLRMRAKNYELINAPRRRGSMLYGKLFIDFMSFISGTLNNMKIYGNATMLNRSDITYVMLDAPIESDKELDGLVEFVNFSDTTSVATQEEEINLGNTNVDLTLNIEDGAKINADFDENRSSYITLQGGGNLHLTYTNETGIGLTGTYSMSDGQLKYALPVIPLKTFSIADGSKVTWNGDIFNPDIDITALERVITSVTFEDNSMQPVTFDVGVKLSNTLSNMGLAFTLSAPENAMVQDQLNALDESTLNKYALTMLITGTYIGGTNSMTASGALSSFLDAKINDLAGDAMKSVSVNVGINDAQNTETGSTYKNYSFSFSKRFWNDRLTIVIGGEVNSGDYPQGSESFINNVSLEWKVSKNSNRFIRLFYDKNYESLLEGEITETGVGYVYKRKLNSLNELFIFRKKEEPRDTMIPGSRSPKATRDEKGEKKEKQ